MFMLTEEQRQKLIMREAELETSNKRLQIENEKLRAQNKELVKLLSKGLDLVRNGARHYCRDVGEESCGACQFIENSKETLNK